MRAPASTAGKLLPAGLALLSLFALGTVGFHAAFGGGWAVSLYRTLVTASTLGTRRTIPHTPGQYVLIGGLAVLGYAAWALTVAVVASTLVAIDVRSLWGGASVANRIAGLRGHTIVVGGGRVGQQVALELRRLGKALVVVDRDEARTRHLTEAGFLVLARDAMEEGTFAEAGVDRASDVVLALPDDAQNLYALLAIRDVAPGIRVIARAESARAERHLRALGVARVVLPTALGGKRLARLVTRPISTDFLDTIVDEAGLELREQEVVEGDVLAGKRVREIRVYVGEGVTLLAIHRDGRTIPLPPAEAELRAGDTLLLVTMAHGD